MGESGLCACGHARGSHVRWDAEGDRAACGVLACPCERYREVTLTDTALVTGVRLLCAASLIHRVNTVVIHLDDAGDITSVSLTSGPST